MAHRRATGNCLGGSLTKYQGRPRDGSGVRGEARLEKEAGKKVEGRGVEKDTLVRKKVTQEG